MYQVANAVVRNALDSNYNNVMYTGHIQFGNTDIYGPTIKNVEICTDWPTTECSYTIGNVICQTFKAEVQSNLTLENQEIEFLTDVILPDLDNSFENVPIGIYIIDTCEVNGEIVTISGSDRMQFASQNKYSSILTYPAQIGSVAAEICSQCGLQLDSSFTFPSFTISNAIEASSCRDALSVIAELVAANVYMSRNGKVLFKVLEHHENSYIIDADRHYSFTHSQNSFNLATVVCKTASETLTSGGGKGIAISNNYVTQDKLDFLLSNVTCTYYGGICEFLGDPTLDICDLICCEDKAGASYPFIIMSRTMTFDGGFKDTIESYAESDTQVSSKRESISKKYASLEKNLEGFKFLVGEQFVTGETFESSLDILSDQINMKVSSTDLTGENLISLINLYPGNIKMQAKNIDLTGYATFSAMEDNSTITTINGCVITCKGQYTYRPMGEDTQTFNSKAILSSGKLVVDNNATGAAREVINVGWEGISTGADPNTSSGGLDLRSNIFSSMNGVPYKGATVYADSSPAATMSRHNAVIMAPQYQDEEANHNKCVFSHHIVNGAGCIDYGPRTANAETGMFNYYAGITVKDNGEIYCLEGGNGNTDKLATIHAKNIPKRIVEVNLNKNETLITAKLEDNTETYWDVASDENGTTFTKRS